MKYILFFLSIFLLHSLSVSSQTLSGIYTVGSAPSDYSALDEAVQDIVTNGIDSAVVFNVKPGIYTEQIKLPPIQGASSLNTITFQSESGDSSDVILQFDADTTFNNYVIGFDTASYITIKNMTIIALDTLYGCAISIAGGSQYITVSNDVIQGNGSTYPVIYSTYNDYLTIQNNNIKDGKIGVYLLGEDINYETGNNVTGNSIINSYNAGIYAKYQWRQTLTGNIISHPDPQEDTWAGISLVNCTGNTNNKSLIANNMISCNANRLAGGIELYASNYQEIFYNSIHMYGNATDSRSFDQEAGGGSNVLKNNILSNEAGGVLYYMENSNSFGSDNNSFYCTSGIFAYFTAFINTFSEWKSTTNKDNHSLEADPLFYSDTDLHINQLVLIGKGSPQPEVTTDIDGEVRDTVRSTIGADRITANCSGPLAGGYAIGASGDFSTFSDAVLAMASCGVGGNVTFYVLPGTYNEQIELSYIPNVTNTDTITFQSQVPDSTSVMLQYDTDSLQNYVVKLSGVKNVLFKDMTFQLLDTTGRVIVLEDSVDNIIFSHTQIIGAQSSLDDDFNDCVFFNQKDDTDTADIEFNNSYIANGSSGVYTKFSSSKPVNLKLYSNTIENQAYAGIFYSGILSADMRSNTFSLPDCDFGITGYADTVIILSNRIYHDGIEAIDATGPSLIANNFIIEKGYYGILVTTSSLVKIYNNTLLIPDGLSGWSYCVQINAYPSETEIRNNCLINLSGVVFGSPGDYYTYNSDYNNLYSSLRIAELDQLVIPTIQDWQDTKLCDLHSVSFLPAFVSATDLHTQSVLLNAKGTPVPEVAFDIDEETRDATHPDIGADEFDNPVFDIPGDTVFCYNTGNYPVYAGSHIYDIGYGYDSYIWSNGSDSSSIVVDSIHTQPGNEQYSVTVTSGGESFSNTVNILYDLPDAGLQSDYCYWDSPFVITANPGYTYNWSTGDTTQSIIINSGWITPELTLTDEHGCKSRKSIHIHGTFEEPANITPSDASICRNQPLTLQANTYANDDVYDKYSFKWNVGDTTQNLVIDPSILPLGENKFSVTVYLVSDMLCSSADTSFVTIQDCLGIKENDAKAIRIYPNPTNGNLTIQAEREIQSFEVYTLTGELVSQVEIKNKRYAYDVSALSAGIYLLKLNYGNFSKLSKFTVTP